MRSTGFSWLPAWLIAAALAAPEVGLARDLPCGQDEAADAALVSVRLDNDLLGGLGQDGGYTSGVQVTWVSPALRSIDDTACLPRPLAWLAHRFHRLRPAGGERTQMLAGFAMALFTPADREAVALVQDDRPYAAAVLAGIGFDVRDGDRLRHTQLRIGLVGRSVRGEQIQNGFHHVIGAQRFGGWGNQLHDEPVVQLLHERSWRWSLRRQSPGGVASDWIGHAGLSLGNLLTHANAGAQWRIGARLPQDFGSDPLRPAGDHLSSRGTAQASGVHGFVSVDLRAVARNLTLDGNTWRASHRVDKRPWVADLGVGVAITPGDWKIVLVHVSRTREFEGQRRHPAFGSLMVSRRL